MRTTIDLPDEVYREAKIMAVKRGTTLKDLVVGLIQSGLREAPAARGAQTAMGRSAPPIAIRKVAGQAPTQALSNRQLLSLLEEEELASSRSSRPGQAEPSHDRPA